MRSWKQGLSWVIVFGAVLTMLSATSCSTTGSSQGDTWRVNFFTDPDSVWAAIHLALIEHDYDVIEENRPDGVIRAQSSRPPDGTVIALAIDQVTRPQDQVSVFIRPSFGGEGSTNPDLLKAAADQFVSTLRAKLPG